MRFARDFFGEGSLDGSFGRVSDGDVTWTVRIEKVVGETATEKPA